MVLWYIFALFQNCFLCAGLASNRPDSNKIAFDLKKSQALRKKNKKQKTTLKGIVQGKVLYRLGKYLTQNKILSRKNKMSFSSFKRHHCQNPRQI